MSGMISVVRISWQVGNVLPPSCRTVIEPIKRAPIRILERWRADELDFLSAFERISFSMFGLVAYVRKMG
jgi:hypothetical protein